MVANHPEARPQRVEKIGDREIARKDADDTLRRATNLRPRWQKIEGGLPENRGPILVLTVEYGVVILGWANT